MSSKVAKGVVVAILATVASAALIEGALRAGVIPNDRQKGVAAERLWRTAEQRLLILGDSFFARLSTTGRTVAEGLAEQGIAVRNLAVSGTGPFEYLERLRSARFDPPPDIVLMGYYVGNDLTDVQDNPKHDSRAHGTAIRLHPPGPPPAGPKDLFSRLYVSDFFRGRPEVVVDQGSFDWAKLAKTGMDPGLIEDARAGRINPWLTQLALRNPHHLLDNVLMEREENQAAWQVGRALIMRAQGLAERRGARFLLLAFPRSIQIDDSHFDFFEKLTFETDERTVGSRVPQDHLAELCEERKIPFLDLLPHFAAHEGGPLYLEKDDHLNRTGQRLAASFIVPFVLEHARAAGH